jgi:hypothetical protein
MEVLLQYVTYMLAGIGILAFFVSVVVQVIKEMPWLKKIQTNVVALAVSLIITPIAVVVLCMYFNIVITWYYIFASILAAFVVYLVSTGGWEKVSEMWNRSKYNKK